jgi:hypothetical protein
MAAPKTAIRTPKRRLGRREGVIGEARDQQDNSGHDRYHAGLLTSPHGLSPRLIGRLP